MTTAKIVRLAPQFSIVRQSSLSVFSISLHVVNPLMQPNLQSLGPLVAVEKPQRLLKEEVKSALFTT